ncbi:hypothetical protein PanWU01x14_355740 [Parasponia andersonii]|uniref:Uncharacterized protein n=1 Tax=Parasponia andersonii TaxID=3476 RepID=A0A2P5A953_PARAD|nr:hypothetical protein PanWU01x14_355740 [Parasponia andersonii]
MPQRQLVYQRSKNIGSQISKGVEIVYIKVQASVDWIELWDRLHQFRSNRNSIHAQIKLTAFISKLRTYSNLMSVVNSTKI